MMNTKWSKKKFSSALAFLLALTLSVSNLPVTAYAAETSGQDTANGSEQSASDISGNLAESTLTVTASEEQTYVPEDGLLADNDELAEGYIETVLGISDEAATVGTYGESSLSGLNATLYKLLMEKVKAVAGATESTSTVFTFSASDLGLTMGTYYTAETLGVSSLGTTDENGNFSVSSDVTSALSEKMGADYDLDKIMNLLLVNCPYELYWYDKTMEDAVKSGSSFGFGLQSSNGTYSIAITSYTLSVSFTVASGYQDSDSDTPTYTVNGEMASKAQAAAKTAQEIVSSNSGLSDYEKLLVYKTKICYLVSYNTAAAAEDSTTAFGDPWQLIYVFDGDDDTKVVCEGYSKAFQYLCDLTDFSSDNVICYTVTGTMSGGTGAGAHMWNIVTMDDGKNYIVDVTNCDEGTIGADAQLFLAGTAGSITSGYTFAVESGTTVGYVYDEDTKELYGTDSSSILNLTSSKYVPKTTVTTDDFTVTLPSNLVYDGNAKEVTVTKKNTGIGTVTVNYYDESGSLLDGAPVNAGTYTVKLDVAASDTYSAASNLTDSNWKFIIAKADPTATAPSVTATYGQTLKDLTLENPSGNTAGTWAWTDSSQSVGDIGTKTFTATFKPSNATNYNSKENVEISVTVSAKSLESDDISTSSIANQNYTGAALEPAVTVTNGSTTLTAGTDYSVAYSANTNVGTASVTITGTGNYTGEKTVTFSIVKAAASVTTAPTANTLTYTGSAQNLVTAGSASGGTMVYSLTEDGTYAETIPTGTNADNYTVYYYAKGDSNHSDSEVGCVSVTISKATPNLGTVSVASPATIYMSNTDSITLSRTDTTVPGTLALDVNQTFTVGTKEYSYTFTPKDMDNYETVTGKIEITVTPNTLSSISVGSATPIKTAYTYGDTFDTTGLTVTATYANGTTADVTSDVTFDSLSVGQTEITLSYTEDGKTVTCTVSGITVVKATLTAGGETTLTAPYGAKLSEITSVLTAKLGTDEVEGSWAWVYDTTYTAETILDANTAAYTLTTKFTPASGADNYNELTQTISLTITKVDPVVTAPTANNLTYTGDAQALVTAGSTTGGSLYYSLNGETYTNTVPTAAGAGDYTVYYKVTGGSNYNDVAATAVSVTIRQATPVLGTVSVSAPETIYPSTALSAVTLSRTDTTVPGTLALAADQTFTAGTKEYSYTFTPEDTDNYETVTGTLAITVTANTLVSVSAGDTEPTKTDYTYGESFDTTGLTVTATYADGSKADVTGKVTYGALVAGQTEITLTYTEDGISASCTISGITVSKATPVVTAPTANELTYNGKTQALVTAGSTTGGTLYYSLDGENYTNTVPTATETGTYTVYYKVLGGSNYEDTAPQTLEVTVKPETTSKLVTKEGIQEIPETLKAAGFDTEEKITTAMLEKVVVESSGYTSENSKVYDAELWVSTDGGKIWTVATEENFPQEGLTVTLPYPDGTSKDGYEFSVAHMFTHTMYGHKPGEIETPTVTKTDEGIQFTVRGLSPIMVAWKEVSQESSDTQTESDDSSQETDAESSDSSQETGTTASTSPVTGDTNALWLWIAVLAAAVGVMVGLVWYRKAKK